MQTPIVRDMFEIKHYLSDLIYDLESNNYFKMSNDTTNMSINNKLITILYCFDNGFKYPVRIFSSNKIFSAQNKDEMINELSRILDFEFTVDPYFQIKEELRVNKATTKHLSALLNDVKTLAEESTLVLKEAHFVNELKVLDDIIKDALKLKFTLRGEI